MPYRWDNAGKIRKEQIESGVDITFSNVFIPFFTNEVIQHSYESIVEIGSGTGHLANTLGEYCKHYIALEPSVGMFNVSKQVITKNNVRVLNKTIEEFSSYDSFDLVLSHLCLHAMENVDIFFEKIYNLLNNDGKWIFSIPHPCFYNEYKKMIPNNYKYMTCTNVDFDLTISNDDQAISKVPYYHRPLEFYVNRIFKTNLVLEEIKEVFPSVDVQALYGVEWKNPRYIIFRGSKK